MPGLIHLVSGWGRISAVGAVDAQPGLIWRAADAWLRRLGSAPDPMSASPEPPFYRIAKIRFHRWSVVRIGLFIRPASPVECFPGRRECLLLAPGFEGADLSPPTGDLQLVDPVD